MKWCCFVKRLGFLISRAVLLCKASLVRNALEQFVVLLQFSRCCERCLELVKLKSQNSFVFTDIASDIQHL